MPEFAFKKGWNQLPKGLCNKCRDEIMSALDITALPTFYARVKGEVEPRFTEIRKIEAIFAEYGITDIWGE